MNLFLIRHAHAVDVEENPLRPLSARGRTQVAQLVAFFRVDGRLTPAEIWHSPLVRSRETAALLATGLQLNAPLIEKSGLEPEDNPRAWVGPLIREKTDIAIVGHEPHLGVLATLLVHGSDRELHFEFKKGGVLALERTGERWVVKWETAPGQMAR